MRVFIALLSLCWYQALHTTNAFPQIAHNVTYNATTLVNLSDYSQEAVCLWSNSSSNEEICDKVVDFVSSGSFSLVNMECAGISFFDLPAYPEPVTFQNLNGLTCSVHVEISEYLIENQNSEGKRVFFSVDFISLVLDLMVDGDENQVQPLIGPRCSFSDTGVITSSLRELKVVTPFEVDNFTANCDTCSWETLFLQSLALSLSVSGVQDLICEAIDTSSMIHPSRSPSSSPSTAIPSRSPSLSPSRSPTTSEPTTAVPSKSPTTKTPTQNPTTPRPTTAVPSNAPTTTKTPTQNPTTPRPTTAIPSKAPTTETSTSSTSSSPTSLSTPRPSTRGGAAALSSINNGIVAGIAGGLLGIMAVTLFVFWFIYASSAKTSAGQADQSKQTTVTINGSGKEKVSI